MLLSNKFGKENVMANNPVVWFEIYVEDIERAKKFYEDVLQTKLEKLNNPALSCGASDD